MTYRHKLLCIVFSFLCFSVFSAAETNECHMLISETREDAKLIIRCSVILHVTMQSPGGILICLRIVGWYNMNTEMCVKSRC